jgi:hypothetical protein
VADGFDLDGFIGETVEVFREKHQGSSDGARSRIVRAFGRAAHEQQARERIERVEGPKTGLVDDRGGWRRSNGGFLRG